MVLDPSDVLVHGARLVAALNALTRQLQAAKAAGKQIPETLSQQIEAVAADFAKLLSIDSIYPPYDAVVDQLRAMHVRIENLAKEVEKATTAPSQVQPPPPLPTSTWTALMGTIGLLGFAAIAGAVYYWARSRK